MCMYIRRLNLFWCLRLAYICIYDRIYIYMYTYKATYSLTYKHPWSAHAYRFVWTCTRHTRFPWMCLTRNRVSIHLHPLYECVKGEKYTRTHKIYIPRIHVCNYFTYTYKLFNAVPIIIVHTKTFTKSPNFVRLKKPCGCRADYAFAQEKSQT